MFTDDVMLGAERRAEVGTEAVEGSLDEKTSERIKSDAECMCFCVCFCI